jgi:hypothetical protein
MVKVKYLLPNDSKLKKLRTYLCETDPLAQIQYGIGSKELERKLKLQVLLSGQVVVPASHVVKSAKTYKVLKRHEALLQKGIIIASLANKYQNFHTYNISAVSQNILSEPITPRVLDERTNFLEDNACLCIRWDFKKRTETYRQAFVEDIEDRASPLSRILNPKTLIKIRNLILVTDTPTRWVVLSFGKRLSRPKWDEYVRYCTALYHLNGAYESNGILNVPLAEIPYLSDKLSRSLIGHEHSSCGYYGKEIFFEEYLSQFGMSFNSLDLLDDDSLIALTKDNVTKKFQHTFYKILSEAMLRATQEPKVELTDVKTELKQAIASEVSTQKRKYRKYQTSIGKVSSSVYLSNIVTTISGGVLFPSFLLSLLREFASWWGMSALLQKRLETQMGFELVLFAQRYGYTISTSSRI